MLVTKNNLEFAWSNQFFFVFLYKLKFKPV